MENTGRITTALDPRLAQLVFGATADEAIDAELRHSTEVDRAHLVMLAERRLIPAEKAAALLEAITQLRASDFSPLRGRRAPRGLYLLYEDYLSQTLGAETGGLLQTGRSRNDLNATTLRLRMREPFQRLLDESVRLLDVLVAQAKRFGALVMPAYTHFQAAVPISLGHYLAGVGLALARDVGWLDGAGSDLGRCPLGAGAVGGTSIPIDPARTAALLGFGELALNSVDAVASRDLVLRLAAAMSVLGVTLSRVSTDLLLWQTAEFGFLALPDHLVGSSSMMPQKRNPFLLEHVKGRCSSALGAFSAATVAMHATPFTNAVAVGTEAASHIWRAFHDTASAVLLMRAVLEELRPNGEAMRRRAVEGYTAATVLCERLVTVGGVPFREAHRRVGEIVSEAERQGEGLETAAARLLGEQGGGVASGLEPEAVRRACRHGGGPSDESLESCLQQLQGSIARSVDAMRRREDGWRAASASLDDVVRSLCRELR